MSSILGFNSLSFRHPQFANAVTVLEFVLQRKELLLFASVRADLL